MGMWQVWLVFSNSDKTLGETRRSAMGVDIAPTSKSRSRHTMSLHSDIHRTYVPPRQAWGEAGRSSPLNPASQPAELPNQTGHRRVSSGDHYFEDVDPRFA